MAKKKAKRAAKPTSKKGVGNGDGNVPPSSSGGSTSDVPRENVGAAVQAAVSFENASIVTAKATDETRKFFRVSWE